MYVFIINPIAGNGRAKQLFLQLTTSKIYKSLKSIHFYTEYQGHAEEIAYHISMTYKADLTGMIVVGGDGTLHEVVNGLTDQTIPVSIIPSGSGNDFARGCSINGTPSAILERIIKRKSDLPYWLGEYTTNHQHHKRYFANSIGFGFDAEIAETANRSLYKKFFNRLKLGRISYVIALLQVLFRFKPMSVAVDINGKSRTFNDCWMITITNHPFYGGGMKIIPFAKIQPLKFPVLVINSISKFKILSLFMTVFTGDHVKFKEVEIIEATKVKVTSANQRDLIYQVDGETATCQSCTINKQVQPIIINGTTHEIRLHRKIN